MTLRGSTAGIHWQNQSGDSEFTKVTKVTHILHTLYNFFHYFHIFSKGLLLVTHSPCISVIIQWENKAYRDKSIIPPPLRFGVTWFINIQKLNRIITQYYIPFLPWALSKISRAPSHQNKSKLGSFWDCSYSQYSKKSPMDYPLPKVIINCIDIFYI